jgi:hypothetical protein
VASQPVGRNRPWSLPSEFCRALISRIEETVLSTKYKYSSRVKMALNDTASAASQCAASQRLYTCFVVKSLEIVIERQNTQSLLCLDLHVEVHIYKSRLLGSWKHHE